MSEQLREALSAVVDGEADQFETRRVLDEISRDDELQAKWDRYHLVSSMMRGMPMDEGRPEILWARNETEPQDAVDDVMQPAVESSVASGQSWLGRLTAVGVAAGAALAVVFYVGQDNAPVGAELADVQPSAQEQTARVRTASVQTASGAPAVLPPAPVVQAPLGTPTELDMRRANAYMIHHAQHTSMSNRAATIPFVKVVAYETRNE